MGAGSTPSNKRHLNRRSAQCQTTRSSGTSRRGCSGLLSEREPIMQDHCEPSRNGDSTMRPTSHTIDTTTTRRRVRRRARARGSPRAAATTTRAATRHAADERSRSGRLGSEATADTGGRPPRTRRPTRPPTRPRPAAPKAACPRRSSPSCRPRSTPRRRCARVRAAGAGVLRVADLAGKKIFSMPVASSLTGCDNMAQWVVGHRPVGRDGGVVLLPERRWPAGLAGRHGTGDQRRLRRRRPRLRHRSRTR